MIVIDDGAAADEEGHGNSERRGERKERSES
jgi:hypothetical protein